MLWLLALAVDYAGPVMRYRTPGLGSSRTEEWTIEGTHFAERCQLFIIIALGESILVTGTTFGEIEASALTVCAFVVAFRQRGCGGSTSRAAPRQLERSLPPPRTLAGWAAQPALTSTCRWWRGSSRSPRPMNSPLHIPASLERSRLSY